MNVIFRRKVIFYKVQFDEYRVDGTDSVLLINLLEGTFQENITSWMPFLFWEFNEYFWHLCQKY